MKTGKLAEIVFCICLIISLCIPAALPAEAASGPSVATTLTDGATQRGSRKTFDVWAKSASGKKIDSSVTLNGQPVSHTWDDSEKTSYTLLFTKEGENTVTVSAADGGKKKEVTYRIIYKKAASGEKIGSAVWCVEGFTLGSGYIIPPIEAPIYEGETSAEQLLRLLSENGFSAYYGGSVKSAFYLAYIADGTRTQQKYNGYQKSAAPAAPRSLNINVSIPSVLSHHLSSTMNYFEPDDYAENNRGCLGEFVITNGSGWMYCVNNNFPNVGFADTYLSDGDVVRVQFTLGYGADIGGASAVGGTIPGAGAQPAGYYSVANKDTLTKAICLARASGLMSRSNVKSAYDAALAAVEKPNASQSETDSAAAALNRALQNPSSDTQQTTQTPSGGASASSTSASDSSSQGSQSPGSSGASQSSDSKTEAGKGSSTAGGDKTSHSTDCTDTSETKADDTIDSEPTDVKESGSTDASESARDISDGNIGTEIAEDDGGRSNGDRKTVVIIVICAAVLVAAPAAAAATVFILKKMKAANHAKLGSLSEKAMANTEIGPKEGEDPEASDPGKFAEISEADKMSDTVNTKNKDESADTDEKDS